MSCFSFFQKSEPFCNIEDSIISPEPLPELRPLVSLLPVEPGRNPSIEGQMLKSVSQPRIPRLFSGTTRTMLLNSPFPPPGFWKKNLERSGPVLWPLGPSAKSSPTVPWQQRHDPNSSPQWSTPIGMSGSPWIFSTVLSSFRIKKQWTYLEVCFVCKIVWLHWILKNVSIAHSFRDSAVWPLDQGQNKWIDVSLMIHLQWFPPFHIFSNPAKIGRSPVHRP